MHAPRPLSVLIVEDIRDGTDSLAILMRYFEHLPCVVHTPEATLEAAGRVPPDVVVVDIGIDGMDGFNLARQLCQSLTRRPLLVSVAGLPGMEVRSREEGFDRHFTKPADPAELHNLLTAHAARFVTGPEGR